MKRVADRCLELPAAARLRIVEWAAAAVPREACGLLVGETAADRARVARAITAQNLERDRPRERYTLAPEDFLAAERAARADGLEVIGFWHSHPSTGARPSPVDRAAAWEGYSYLIVSLAGAEPELRSWRLVGDRFEEEALAIAALPPRGAEP